jgi:NAD(P)-dependent dehydrogenase (short-subunit alcohol dehydrogenase family)
MHAKLIRPGLENKVALVTNAHAGLGQEVALRLAAEGAHVVIHHPSGTPAREKAQEVAGRLAGAGFCVASHLNDHPSIERVIEEILGRYGRLDIAVNSHGSPLLSRMSTRQMIQQGSGGRLILIGSSQSSSCSPFGVGSRNFGRELAAHHITVNHIVPPATPGALPRLALDPGDDRSPFESLEERHEQKAEIAELAAFLAASTGNQITGRTYHIDEGTRVYLAAS